MSSLLNNKVMVRKNDHIFKNRWEVIINPCLDFYAGFSLTIWVVGHGGYSHPTKIYESNHLSMPQPWLVIVGKRGPRLGDIT